MRVSVRNAEDEVMTLHLEPWGDDIPMAAGETIVILAHGPVPDDLAMGSEDGRIVVWGCAGSMMTLYRDGVQIAGLACMMAPAQPMAQGPTPLPEGHSARGLLHLVQKDEEPG